MFASFDSRRPVLSEPTGHEWQAATQVPLGDFGSHQGARLPEMPSSARLTIHPDQRQRIFGSLVRATQGSDESADPAAVANQDAPRSAFGSSGWANPCQPDERVLDTPATRAAAVAKGKNGAARLACFTSGQSTCPSSDEDRHMKLPTTLVPVLSIVTAVADCATVRLATISSLPQYDRLLNLTGAHFEASRRWDSAIVLPATVELTMRLVKH